MPTKQPTKKNQKKTPIINRCDALARQLNLLVHGNRCEKCGKSGEVYKMDWSHVYSRESKSIRWDMDNCMVHCFTCHKWWHEWPLETKPWFDEKYPGRRERLLAKLQHARPLTIPELLRIEQQLKDALS